MTASISKFSTKLGILRKIFHFEFVRKRFCQVISVSGSHYYCLECKVIACHLHWWFIKVCIMIQEFVDSQNSLYHNYWGSFKIDLLKCIVTVIEISQYKHVWYRSKAYYLGWAKGSSWWWVGSLPLNGSLNKHIQNSL